MPQLMIFAAGFGSRIASLNLQLPKALINIGNTTILEYILNHYQVYCDNPFVINTHYFSK